MGPVDFVRSLYLGDRACKSIMLDGWNGLVRITVDTISRIPRSGREWNFDTSRDIVEGVLVFEGVTFFELKNGGAMPNDCINSIEAKPWDTGVEVVISIDSVDADSIHHETIVVLRCQGIHIEDPLRPGLKVTD